MNLLLLIPDRGEVARSFKIGATVAFVKLTIEQEFGIQMDKIVLKANGRVLIDPFSLSDLPRGDLGVAWQVEWRM